MTRDLPHPDPAEFALGRVLAALADPLRRRMIGQLAEGPDDQACGAFELGVAKSTSTHHFRVLREAGLIRQRHAGVEIRSTLRRDEIEARFPGLLEAVLRGE